MYSVHVKGDRSFLEVPDPFVGRRPLWGWAMGADIYYAGGGPVVYGTKQLLSRAYQSDAQWVESVKAMADARYAYEHGGRALSYLDDFYMSSDFPDFVMSAPKAVPYSQFVSETAGLTLPVGASWWSRLGSRVGSAWSSIPGWQKGLTAINVGTTVGYPLMWWWVGLETSRRSIDYVNEWRSLGLESSAYALNYQEIMGRSMVAQAELEQQMWWERQLYYASKDSYEGRFGYYPRVDTPQWSSGYGQ